MRPDKQLDFAVFQLNSDRTRCELLIAAQGMTYKLAAGLLHPFVAHLKAAEVQLSGGGYSIRLEPPDPACAGWFTKGTMERFVRFVSTPEILEQVSIIEIGLLETDKAMASHSGDVSEDIHHAEELLSKLGHSIDAMGGAAFARHHLEKPSKDSLDAAQMDSETTQDNTKQLLLRSLKAKQMMLAKELEIALARAVSAGFTVGHVKELIAFAETFGAKRLWEASLSLLSSFKRRQQMGVWQDDLKLPVVDLNQNEAGFSGNIMDSGGFRDNSNGYGKAKRHDDLRRASLPGNGLPLLVDSGLSKLTRRGSLDEHTGEFLQVAARMRSSGMLEGAHADGYNDLQSPIGGRNRPISGEMHFGAPHLVGSIDVRDGRGQQLIPAWNGPPQSYPMQNVHPLMCGTIHPLMPTPFGYQGLPLPAYSYSSIPSAPCLYNVLSEASGWQYSSPTRPFWPHPVHDIAVAPTANDGGIPNLTSLKENANCTGLSNNGCCEQPTLSSQKVINEPSSALSNSEISHGEHLGSIQTSENDGVRDTAFCKERPVSELSVAVDEPAASFKRQDTIEKEPLKETSSSELSVGDEPTCPTKMLNTMDRELHKEATASEFSAVENSVPCVESSACKFVNYDEIQVDSTQRSSINQASSDGIQQAGITQHQPPVSIEVEEENTIDSVGSEDGELLIESTRQLPIRSSSPSLRSASPLRKVQIGRAGSRKTIRGLNHLVQSISEKMERENKGMGSSESWSEDDHFSKIVEEPKEEPMRSSVQDVIGLFERKKDAGDTTSNLLRKNIGREKSDKSVLKRWNEIAFTKEGVAPEAALATNQHRERGLLASDGGGSEMNSNEVNISGSPDGRKTGVKKENGELLAAGNVECCAKQAFVQQLARKLSKATQMDPQKSDSKSDSMLSSNVLCDTDSLISESSKVSHGKVYNMPVGDGVPAFDVHQRTGLGEILHEEAQTANPKKLSSQDERVKLMQEMLERRKAWGNQAVKPNPLAKAQVRAEELRAYKADLQKSKQQKDEAEKKRIDDLKSQRKERTGARNGHLGAFSAQSPASKQHPQTPFTASNRSSPAVTSKKYSSSNSKQMSIDLYPSSLPPKLPKVRGFSNNKLARAPTGFSKADENALSCSVPTLNESKKERPKPMTGLRSNAGSQRLSQVKKNLKNADPNVSLKANGHSVEEKKRSVPLITVRKGIPSAYDSKNEGSTVMRKSRKGLSAAKQQQKKADCSPEGMMKPPAKTLEAEFFLEQTHIANDAAIDECLIEAGNDEHDLSSNKDTSLVQEVGATEDVNGQVQISVSSFSDVQSPGCIDNSCLAYCKAASSELLISKDFKEMEGSMLVEKANTDLTACIESNHLTNEDGKTREESYFAPVAEGSQTNELSKDIDDINDNLDFPLHDCSTNLHVSTEECPTNFPTAAGVYDAALPVDSPPNIPKNLPSLHEAIQQVHSPDYGQGANGSRKTRDESNCIRSTKNHHARGLKRLFFLGRKSNRSSLRNSGEGSPVCTVSDAGDSHYISTSKKDVECVTSTADTVTSQVDKGRESHLKSSSTKGTKSFFSLSTFRGKGDGK